jgi:aspartyl/asparaginyl beta-hydroxylase (cupin superfamily)
MFVNASSRLTTLTFACLSFIFLIKQLNLFLTAISVLPLNSFAISVHLFPNFFWNWSNIKSSESFHSVNLISGFKWLNHLSLHYFPFRFSSPNASFNSYAISFHCLASPPLFVIILIKTWSSAEHHGAFVVVGVLPTLCLYRH